MKKIIVLFLFSVNVYAESFYLVCDGIEDQRSLDEKNLIKKSIGFKITDSNLAYEDSSYETSRNTFYKKTDLQITFNKTNYINDEIESFIQGDIDRISGGVQITYNNFITKYSYYFDGTCKTAKDKAF